MIINTNNILNNIRLNLMNISSENKVDDKSNKELYDSLNSDISASKQNIMNFNDAVGYMQMADSSLNFISKQTEELKTLSVASNNGALNSDNKAVLNNLMKSIQENITKTLDETSYNGRNVFSGNFQIGDMNINLNLNPDELDISNPDSIDKFAHNISTLRSDISSFMNGATSNIDNLTKSVVNESASKNNYEVDLMKNLTELKQNELNLSATNIAQAHNSDILLNNIQMLLGVK